MMLAEVARAGAMTPAASWALIALLAVVYGSIMFLWRPRSKRRMVCWGCAHGYHCSGSRGCRCCGRGDQP